MPQWLRALDSVPGDSSSGLSNKNRQSAAPSTPGNLIPSGLLGTYTHRAHACTQGVSRYTNGHIDKNETHLSKRKEETKTTTVCSNSSSLGIFTKIAKEEQIVLFWSRKMEL